MIALISLFLLLTFLFGFGIFYVVKNYKNIPVKKLTKIMIGVTISALLALLTMFVITVTF